MSETLHIRHFGGLEDVTLEFSEVNILIGPQATGKSVCAKLLYFFRKVVAEMQPTALEDGGIGDFEERLKNRFLEFFPPTNWGEGTFRIVYRSANEEITVARNRKKGEVWSLKLSDGFKDAFREVQRLVLESRKEAAEAAGSPGQEPKPMPASRALFMNHWATKTLGDRGARSAIYIPAGRSFFAMLHSTVFTFLSSNTTIDPFMKEFGAGYETVKANYVRFLSRQKGGFSSAADAAADRVLRGKYLREKGLDLVQMADGRRVNLLYCSSGQQEALPLTMVLRWHHWRRYPFGLTAFVEEPEAHLFPVAQKDLVEFFALLRNAASPNPVPTQYVITTHSPYILSAFSNLIFAGHLYKTGTPEQRARIVERVPRNAHIDPDKVRVYYLHDGVADPMHPNADGLIDTTVIDNVANELGRQFEGLLELAE